MVMPVTGPSAETGARGILHHHRALVSPSPERITLACERIRSWHAIGPHMAPDQYEPMTRYLLAGASLLLLPFHSTIMAQGPIFGVKGGLNYTALAVDASNSESARSGFHVGFFGRTSPSNKLGVQAELLYSLKGSSNEYSALFGWVQQTVDLNLNYLELPILASLRVGEIVDLQAGAYAAYLVSASADVTGTIVNETVELDHDDFNALDLGLVVGVAFNIGPHVQTGVRYAHGLVNVANNDNTDLLYGDAKNRSLQLYFGIGLPGN